ncbi:MAG: mercury resistance system transport protein MerF [Coleofasciculus sp. C1-SOL-03]|uniref:mercury resistance system transport protein MerF n=1 Tax=Coleofasciculus sp. C1-SOL-03 TaxID=3069522 RepID=UPI0032F361E5
MLQEMIAFGQELAAWVGYLDYILLPALFIRLALTILSYHHYRRFLRRLTPWLRF